MKKNILKFFINNILFIFLFFPAFIANAQLSDELGEEIRDKSYVFSGSSGFDPSTRIEKTTEVIIEAFLSILGVIFVILIILAGYNWMTASGDEQKVTKAKDTIKRAIIGLLIVVAAYAITYFVFTNLPFGDGGGAGSQT